MKKHIINILLVSLLLNLSTPVTFAQTKLNAILPNRLKQESSGVYVELEESVISTKLEKELKDEIEKVYVADPSHPGFRTILFCYFCNFYDF